MKLPQEIESVGGLGLVAVNDEGDDEGVDDGDHEILGGDEIVRQFPEKYERNIKMSSDEFIRIFCLN